MLKHILVPLDGTPLAESALPAAATLSRALQARITLLHLIEQDAAPEVHGQRHLTAPAEAEHYLNKLRDGLQADGLEVACHVHDQAVSDVAGGIAAHHRELQPDLVVMCTHGGGGLGRLLRGSLAQQVVALGPVPLLLVRPGEKPPPLRLQQLLVPLDGNPEHEAGLDLALELGRVAGSRLQLLCVVTATPALSGREATLSRFMPGTSQVLQELSVAGFQDYLDRQLGRIEKRHLEGAAQVGEGKVDEVIVRTARSCGADLIVLATHGKAGARAFWDNSMAARVLARTGRPLLLVPVADRAGG